MIKLIVIFLVSAILLIGCMSHSVHQTAEILDKDDTELGFALSTYQNGYVNGDIHARFPLSEHFELGLGSSMVLRGFDADFKYQIIRAGEAHKQFAIALQIKPSISFSNRYVYSNLAFGALISKRFSSHVVLYSRFAYLIPLNTFKDLEKDSDNYYSDPYYQEDFEDLIQLNAFVKYQATIGFSFESNSVFLRPEVSFIYFNTKSNDIWIIPSIQLGFYL
ncbi:hypothetical protein JXR93_09290 [bacterium]|nr:hypothetical protein [bacterium]